MAVLTCFFMCLHVKKVAAMCALYVLYTECVGVSKDAMIDSAQARVVTQRV